MNNRKGITMSQKAVLFLAEGFEEIEALTVVDLCRRAGAEIETASITGKKEVESSHKITVMSDILLEDVDFSNVSMMILPGGMPGTRNLEACEPLMAQLDAFYEQGRYISAICAAPSIFAHRGYLKGRPACSFPSFESHLAEGGAVVNRNEVTVTDHMIMSRGMGCAIPFGLAIVERLAGAQKATEVREKIVYEQR